MIKLHGRITSSWQGDPLILRIATGTNRPGEIREDEALLIGDHNDIQRSPGFAAYLSFAPVSSNASERVVVLSDQFRYLSAGDVIRIIPRTGELLTLYRRQARSNAMLLTERCNSNCVMCSQPPREHDDSFLIDVWKRAIGLMDKATPELGITGGEPTLLGERLLDIISTCKYHLPSTALHMLSNGRMFRYLSLCRAIAEIDHHDFMIGIPLYSDIAGLHDHVVQAKGAFDQTIRGIMNLLRSGIRVELRVVLHKQTIPRLPQLGRFIARNLPNVTQVALMGLEMMGYVKSNFDSLWIDPVDYAPSLLRIVRELQQGNVQVAVYNHQLCVLDRELWSAAVKSISDWKNEYLPCCDHCTVREKCGGFFSSTTLKHSRGIRAVTASG